MAYDKNELKKQAIAAAKNPNVFFISDVVALLPCSVSTFYYHELQELEALKKKLSANRIKAKQKLRTKWIENSNAALYI